MKWLRLMCLAAMVGQIVGSAAPADSAASDPERNTAVAKVPPVLRPTEPPDSGYLILPSARPVEPPDTGRVVLPGSASATPATRRSAPAPSAAKRAPLPTKPAEEATLRQPAPPRTVSPSSAKPSPIAASGREAAASCQKQIGRWKESDARKLLGESKRQRPAYDEKKAVNGTIYAYTDPSNQYKELELDFDLRTGFLRTVFVYPPQLTWQDCRKRWSGPVAAADAAQGRKFYSYTNRRLDVLVDSSGKVISLGWY